MPDVISNVISYGSPLSFGKLEEFMRGVFAPRAKGTQRMILTKDHCWRWKSGLLATMEVSEDGKNWRKPTDDDFKDPLINAILQYTKTVFTTGENP